MLLPNSEIFILDKNELDEALKLNLITEEEYNLANDEVEKILKSNLLNKDELSIFSNKYLNKIK